MRDIELITDSGETVHIQYSYDPGEPDQWYDSNGDPGTPGYGPTVEVHRVWYNATDRLGNPVSVDVQDLLEEDFEEPILEYHEQ
jgi:hypothetical protein